MIFRNSFFLYLGLWTLNSSIFDRKFGFYVKNPPWGRLESCQIRHPGQNMTKIIFLNYFFLLITSSAYVGPIDLMKPNKHRGRHRAKPTENNGEYNLLSFSLGFSGLLCVFYCFFIGFVQGKDLQTYLQHSFMSP